MTICGFLCVKKHKKLLFSVLVLIEQICLVYGTGAVSSAWDERGKELDVGIVAFVMVLRIFDVILHVRVWDL